VVNPGDQALRQRQSIPHGRANHQECTGLPCGSTGKRDRKRPPVSLSGQYSNWNCDLLCPGWESKDLGDRSKKGQPPGQSSDAEYDPRDPSIQPCYYKACCTLCVDVLRYIRSPMYKIWSPLCKNTNHNLRYMIHSFFSKIYIEPLQGKYSEALPTPAWKIGKFSNGHKTNH